MVDMSEQDTERSVTPRTAQFAGFFAVAMGLLVVALSADLIRVQPDKFHAPRWVAAAGGLTFVLGGLMLLLLLAVVANWVAFGPGERRFSGVFSVGFWRSEANPGELGGRIVFGIGAVILDLFLIWAWVNWVRMLFKPSGRGDS